MTTRYFSRTQFMNRLPIWGAVLVVLACWQVGFAAGAKGEAKRIAAGKVLFEHRWTENDPLSEKGDGLGPMYNERSCVACHNQAGTGGGGENEQNVDVITARTPVTTNGLERQALTTRLLNTHAGFRAPPLAVLNTRSIVVPTITLHAFGTSESYDGFRRDLRSQATPRKPKAGSNASNTAVKSAGLQFELSQRHTPALYGAGVINAIPNDVILRGIRRHRRRFPEVSGRVASVSPAATPQATSTRRGSGSRAAAATVSGQIGRFGWRGQVGTLDNFVRGACANELGLAIRTHAQPMDPTHPLQHEDDDEGVVETLGLTTERIAEIASSNSTARFVKNPDLTERQCVELTSYVASLESPKHVWPADKEQRRLAEDGQVVFDRIGCIACHAENMGPAEQIYSDLLLHDMGYALSDALPAPTDVSSVGYYGGGRGMFSPITSSSVVAEQEWRTPPLWGAADSAPYMHDGRAATFTDAILAHGGEAEFSAKNFAASSPIDRLALQAFLETLKAPGPPAGPHRLASLDSR